MTPLLDTHCHIDAYTDPRHILDDARQASVDVIAVTESPDGYRRLNTRLGKSTTATVALGLHPASRAAAAPGQLERFLRMLPSAAWLGEVGLDFQAGTDRREKARQLRVFDAILEHPLARALPMTVHSRGAAKEVIERVSQAGNRAILHWYSGPLRNIDEALAGGLSFSINPAMLNSAKGAALLDALPPNRVLLETDGPYCLIQRRPCVPTDITAIARALARRWSLTEDQTRHQLQSNAAALRLRA